MIFSYGPTVPKLRPPNAVARETISIRTIFALASRAAAHRSTSAATSDARRRHGFHGRRSRIGQLLRTIGDRHAQQRRAERLAVRVECERARHTAAQCALEDEVER